MERPKTPNLLKATLIGSLGAFVLGLAAIYKRG